MALHETLNIDWEALRATNARKLIMKSRGKLKWFWKLIEALSSFMADVPMKQKS